MSHLLKQSTAYTFRLGPFLSATDGNTQMNSLTIAYTSVLLSKAGGALTAKAETTDLTGTGANGHYTCILGTGDTGTLGTLRVFCHVATALAVWQDFMILPANVYDALVAATDALQVHVNEITAGVIDRATFSTDTGLQSIRSNTAQAGAAGTITLDASASVVTDFYVGALVLLTGGTGVGQVRFITAYNGTTKVASVIPNWATNPDVTSTFAIVPNAYSVLAAATHTGAVVPTVSTLTGHTAQTGDSYALANGANGFVAIKGDTAAILLDTGTDGVVLPQAQADKVWSTAARALTDKADFALSSASRDAIWDQTGSLSLSFENLIQRAYQILNNKMIVTEASGAVALRNLVDSADIATGVVADLGATTQRDALAWV